MRRSIVLQKIAAVIGIGCAAPLACRPIVLHTPVHQQVFQRDGADSAIVPLEGSAPPSSDEIRVRAIVSPAAASGSSTGWKTVAHGPQVNGGAFKATLKLPKGGWYSLQVEARAKGAVVATDSVSRVGIGDIFVTAGQSNSANWGSTSKHLSAKSDRVVYYDGKAFVHATDPIPGGFGDGSSPWALLGDTLTSWTRCPVCFRSATLTHTPVDQWIPPHSYQFDTLYRRARDFGPRGIKAVLWIHGESDAIAGTTAQDYCTRLTAVIDSLRNRLGYRVDWFVSGTSYHTQATAADIAKIYEGQKQLWQSGCAFEGPYTNDMLGTLYRAPDGVHFNEKGLREMVARWYPILTKAYWPPLGVAEGLKMAPLPLREIRGTRSVHPAGREALGGGTLFDIRGRRLVRTARNLAPGVVVVKRVGG